MKKLKRPRKLKKANDTDHQEQFLAEWRSAPAGARRVVGFACLAGILWAVRILWNAAEFNGGIKITQVLWAVMLLIVMFLTAYAAINRNRIQYVALTTLTVLSLIGPLQWIVNAGPHLFDGKLQQVPGGNGLSMLSAGEFIAGVFVLICLFTPAVFRYVWNK